MNGIREKIILIVLTSQTTLLIIIGTALYVSHANRKPSGPPLIPGATEIEQRGPLIEKGWLLGRRYRGTILTSHADSWIGVSARFEGGKSWDEVKAEWSNEYRKTRDDPFNVVVQPEIDLLMPPHGEPNQQQRHNVGLFLKSFAEGLKDPR